MWLQKSINPVELGTKIIRGWFRRTRVFRDHQNPLVFPDELLYERYRFLSKGLAYLWNLLGPYVASDTRRNYALTVLQTAWIVLRFYATGVFLYSVGDAEHLSKNIECSYSCVTCNDRSPGWICNLSWPLTSTGHKRGILWLCRYFRY